MGNGAHIGFHAAYIETAGQATETGVGNALVGSYLTWMGLSERAVVYITQAAPAEMTWLTLRDAEQTGIDVVPFKRPPPPGNTFEWVKRSAEQGESGFTDSEVLQMAKKTKERIIPPSKKSKTSGSEELKEGSSAGARVMADASVAKRQKVKRPPGR